MSRKTKISHDPNNTNWSRSTSGFGHKILSSQGWTPGKCLGAQNAAHAHLFTAASASHIKVVVKDDTLGLGARSKRNPLEEPTGLDAFKGLLGRLNGKTDVELEAEQQKREDVRLAQYAATRWQTVRFVRGGLLAQEKTDVPDAEKTRSSRSDNASNEKRSRKKNTKAKNDGNAHSLQSAGSPTTNLSETRDSNTEDTAERARKKESKKRKRDTKRKDADGQVHRKEPQDSTKGSRSPSRRLAVISKERRPVGRHAFRGRHIEQKKKSLLDEKSLNEVAYIPAPPDYRDD